MATPLIQSGMVTRSDIAKLTTDARLIKWLDAMQSLVFQSPFNNIGDAEVSVDPADTSIPIIINGIQYYLKLSTTP